MDFRKFKTIVFETSSGYQVPEMVIDHLVDIFMSKLRYIHKNIPDDTTILDFSKSDDFKRNAPSKPQQDMEEFGIYSTSLEIVKPQRSTASTLFLGAEMGADINPKTSRIANKKFALKIFLNGLATGKQYKNIDLKRIEQEVESTVVHEMIHGKSLRKKIEKKSKLRIDNKYQRALSDVEKMNSNKNLRKIYSANKEEVEARIAEIQLFVKNYINNSKDIVTWDEKKLKKVIPYIIRRSPAWEKNAEFWNDGIRKRIMSKVISYVQKDLGLPMNKDGKNLESILMSRLLKYIRSNQQQEFIKRLKKRISEAKQKSWGWDGAKEDLLKKWIVDQGEEPSGDLVKQAEKISLRNNLNEIIQMVYPAFNKNFISQDPVWISATKGKTKDWFNRIFIKLMNKYGADFN